MDLGAAVYKVTEASGLTQSNVRDQLRSALSDAFPQVDGCYSYPWLADIIGDDSTGSIIYELGGKLYRCEYAITADGAARSTKLSISSAEVVMPRMVYDTANGTILEAKRASIGERSFTEKTFGGVELPLAEATGAAKSSYKVKVIQAGQGSSAFYPKEVLKRDGPKVFTKGTKMYWNHPTAQQEATRPEGDLNDLAAVLTTDAAWEESGAKGPGLYAMVSVYPDYAEKLAPRAGDIGVSIRAYGEAENQKATGLTLKNFTRAESIDFVTLPGAGGAVLTEAAKVRLNPNTQEPENMELTEAAVQAMIEKRVAPLSETIATQATTIETQAATIKESTRRAILAEAGRAVDVALKTERLPEASKERVAASLLAGPIPVAADGLLDPKAFGEAIAAAVKSEAEYLHKIGGSQVVEGMGAQVQTTEADNKAAGLRLEQLGREAVRGHGGGAVTEAFAKSFAKGRN